MNQVIGQKASGKDVASPQHIDVDVLLAAEELARLVDPAELLDLKAGPQRPLIILAFDEGHTLTDILGEQGCQWSLFSELCHALRLIVGLPIFSLFLSTAPKFHRFPPHIGSDPSLRLPSLQPITEISFDDLGFPAIEDTVTLNQVIRNKWISHLGRPLYEGFEYLCECQLTYCLTKGLALVMTL
jgi:hypothetical protein